MITSIEDFIKYIPTARGTHYEDILPFLEEGLLWAKTDIFGKDLTDAVETAGYEDGKRMLDAIIALKAYATAIPFLDVVQTSNGFAVVSNANMAPASRERVDKLMAWVENRLYAQVDALIGYLRTSSLLAEWRKFHRFDFMTELLFWTGADFMQYCGDYEKIETISPETTMSYKGGSTNRLEAERRRIPYLELRRLHAMLKGYQEDEIGRFISRDYLHELIDKNRMQTLTATEKALFDKLRFILGLLMQKDETKAGEQLKNIVNMMMGDLGSYPTFANSEEYKVKIALRYQNLEEDPTYFFG